MEISMTEKHENGPNYEVGYKKPPKETRFKPGQSGNPKGGKRKETGDGIAHALSSALNDTVQVTVGGNPQTLSKKEYMVETLGVQAAKGSKRALKGLIKLLKRSEKDQVLEPVVVCITEQDARAAGPHWRELFQNQ
jgi:hypothetical protein